MYRHPSRHVRWRNTAARAVTCPKLISLTDISSSPIIGFAWYAPAARTRADAGLLCQAGVWFKRARDPFTLLDDQYTVERRVAYLFHLPARPANLDLVDSVLLAQPEMNARIVAGQVAFPGTHRRILNEIARCELQSRADPIAIAAVSDGLDGDPVVR